MSARWHNKCPIQKNYWMAVLHSVSGILVNWWFVCLTIRISWSWSVWYRSCATWPVWLTISARIFVSWRYARLFVRGFPLTQKVTELICSGNFVDDQEKVMLIIWVAWLLLKKRKYTFDQSIKHLFAYTNSKTCTYKQSSTLDSRDKHWQLP